MRACASQRASRAAARWSDGGFWITTSLSRRALPSARSRSAVPPVITMNWQLAADAAVAKPKPSRRSRFSVFGGGNASKGEHVHVVQSFGTARPPSTSPSRARRSSASRDAALDDVRLPRADVLHRQHDAARQGDRHAEQLLLRGARQLPVALLVFKSNVSYIRFWEARTHVGSLLNHLRSFTRRLLFGSDLRAGDAQVEPPLRTCSAGSARSSSC